MRIDTEKAIVQCESRKSVYGEQILDVEILKAQLKTLDVTAMLQDIQALESVDRPDTSKLELLRSKVQLELNKIDAKEAELSRACSELDRQKLKLSKLKLEKTTLDNEIECPHCSSSFGLSNGHSVTVEQLEKAKAARIEELLIQIEALEQNIEDYPNLVNKRQELTNILSSALEKQKIKETEFYEAREKINELKYKVAISRSK